MYSILCRKDNFRGRDWMTAPCLRPQSLIALPRKCREYANSLREPDNIAMLRLWAKDLADKADETKRHQTGIGLRRLRGAIVAARRRQHGR